MSLAVQKRLFDANVEYLPISTSVRQILGGHVANEERRHNNNKSNRPPHNPHKLTPQFSTVQKRTPLRAKGEADRWRSSTTSGGPMSLLKKQEPERLIGRRGRKLRWGRLAVP